MLLQLHYPRSFTGTYNWRRWYASIKKKPEHVLSKKIILFIGYEF